MLSRILLYLNQICGLAIVSILLFEHANAQTLKCQVFLENAAVDLTCPPGLSIYATFSSYGTAPARTCGQQVLDPTCHAGGTRIVLRSLW